MGTTSWYERHVLEGGQGSCHRRGPWPCHVRSFSTPRPCHIARARGAALVAVAPPNYRGQHEYVQTRPAGVPECKKDGRRGGQRAGAAIGYHWPIHYPLCQAVRKGEGPAVGLVPLNVGIAVRR